MGSKRNKVKKLLSPTRVATPPPNEADNEELMDDLFAQLDNQDQTVRQESAVVLDAVSTNEVSRNESEGKKDSKSRFMARQRTRRPVDAEADARIQRETKEEEKAIRDVCDDLGVEIHEINPDGHCLFAAIADQLQIIYMIGADGMNYITVRQAAADYIYSHPNDFLPFLPSTHDDSGLMTPEEFKGYCDAMRDTGVWGGEPEIRALCRVYRIPIHVIQGSNPPIVVHDPAGDPDKDTTKDHRVIRISYHRKMYGLGEHYNSLRPKSGFARMTAPIKNLLQGQSS
ncbi:hypothetical protein EVG20_g3995 [Dentipellis fragilis]|uniref:OTU domain-containing protein n=1 Tax=Dentipellis fragilis TaxID=205917 RepID=A0A4Y9YYE1_9AGAM|nr:hypothetical protein EVG20_g3995 [Dentipellis fragilis]